VLFVTEKQSTSIAHRVERTSLRAGVASGEAERLSRRNVEDASFSYFVVRSSEPKNYREKAAQHAECND
jgi:hypothetical protein